MSQLIPLEQVPNQSLSLVIDEARYVLTVKSIDGVCSIDIECNGEVLVSGQRCMLDLPLLPYAYLQAKATGNFAFVGTTDQYPRYPDFGVTCYLIYMSSSELAQ